MRRLATAAAAFSAAVFAANYLLPAGWLPVLGAAFAVSALTLTVFFRGRHTRRAIIPRARPCPRVSLTVRPLR